MWPPGAFEADVQQLLRLLRSTITVLAFSVTYSHVLPAHLVAVSDSKNNTRQSFYERDDLNRVNQSPQVAAPAQWRTNRALTARSHPP